MTYDAFLQTYRKKESERQCHFSRKRKTPTMQRTNVRVSLEHCCGIQLTRHCFLSCELVMCLQVINTCNLVSFYMPWAFLDEERWTCLHWTMFVLVWCQLTTSWSGVS